MSQLFCLESIDKYPAEIKLDYDILKEKHHLTLEILYLLFYKIKNFLFLMLILNMFILLLLWQKNIYPYDSMKYRPNYKIKFYYDGEIRQHTEENYAN